MWQFFVKGGVVMIPLALCSLTALTIIIERALFYYRANRWEEREIKLLKVYLGQGKLEEAKAVTNGWDSALGRVAAVIVQFWGQPRERMEKAAEAAGYAELQRFQRGLAVLDTIVTASPLLGLLGTVTGIIRAFGALSVVTQNQAERLSAGIAEALYTTAFGLCIAVPVLFCVNFFYKVVEKQAQKLTFEAEEIMAIMQQSSGESHETSN